MNDQCLALTSPAQVHMTDADCDCVKDPGAWPAAVARSSYKSAATLSGLMLPVVGSVLNKRTWTLNAMAAL